MIAGAVVATAEQAQTIINLSLDKPKVFAEMHRVLRPGGRIGISDVVADDELAPAQRAERSGYVGCIAGTLSFQEFEEGLRAAGFEDISVTSTDEPHAGMHNAIIKATKQVDSGSKAPASTRELPVVQGSCC